MFAQKTKGIGRLASAILRPVGGCQGVWLEALDPPALVSYNNTVKPILPAEEQITQLLQKAEDADSPPPRLPHHS